MNRQLEVGKTYRAVNGATITVTGKQPWGHYVAKVVNNPDWKGMDSGDMLYRLNGECYGLPQLNVDWESAPDTDQSAPDIDQSAPDIDQSAPDIDQSAPVINSRKWWSSDPDYPVSDWQHQVREDNTRLGYWDWVSACRESDQGD